MSIADFEIKGQFTPGLALPDSAGQIAWWFIFRGRQLLVDRRENQWLPVRTQKPHLLGMELRHSHYLGHLDGTPVHCAEAVEGADPLAQDFVFMDLRTLHERLPNDLFVLSWRAVQIVDWDRNHQYCGRCGSAMLISSRDRVKECAACGNKNFPRISPAVMVLVQRSGELLLARGPNFPAGFFSLVAGFVEPGETLETCVHREIKEEIGITVTNIRYFGSQPWPFPDSLMISFIADYAGGEIQVDGQEIIEAAWYRPDDLPQIPGVVSLAGKMILWFIRRGSQASA